MRFAYLTTDDVNLDLARRWAQECGCQLDSLSPRDPLPQGGYGSYDAVICDLDYLPAPVRQQVLIQLLASDMSSPIVVHGYNLGQDEVRALRARGVLVQRRLERETIRYLTAHRKCGAAARTRLSRTAARALSCEDSGLVAA